MLKDMPKTGRKLCTRVWNFTREIACPNIGYFDAIDAQLTENGFQRCSVALGLPTITENASHITQAGFRTINRVYRTAEESEARFIQAWTVIPYKNITAVHLAMIPEIGSPLQDRANLFDWVMETKKGKAFVQWGGSIGQRPEFAIYRKYINCPPIRSL